ncbi:MAG: hypothetical protein OXF20_07395 [Gammaproteobacteria bacterium]|nr:hypothetical protein [Gammaproteobacteria bacterium]
MNELPDRCLVDTNVPITADSRLALHNNENDYVSQDCIDDCAKVIEHIIKNGGLVIDDGYEILTEYWKNLNRLPGNEGQHGHAMKFLKWVTDHQGIKNKVTLVKITQLDDTYKEFPVHDGLKRFDISDRKFVAVANAYPSAHKPPIFQARDSKWWGWKDALSEVGIKVRFLCPDYVKEKYREKVEEKNRKKKEQ